MNNQKYFPAQGATKHLWFCHLFYLLSKNNTYSLRVIAVVLFVLCMIPVAVVLSVWICVGGCECPGS